jgi:hypothetical protein
VLRCCGGAGAIARRQRDVENKVLPEGDGLFRTFRCAVLNEVGWWLLAGRSHDGLKQFESVRATPRRTKDTKNRMPAKQASILKSENVQKSAPTG